MALNPEDKPREFPILVIAALSFAFSEQTPVNVFDEAEKFVEEAERRYGPVNSP